MRPDPPGPRPFRLFWTSRAGVLARRAGVFLGIERSEPSQCVEAGQEAILASPCDIQPTVATILAIRAGLRDAHQNRPAFLWAVLWDPANRRELLRQGWNDVGKVFLLATILDVIYQLVVHRGVYILELLITAVALAVIPYVLLRGPISRIARVILATRPSVKQRLMR